MQYDEKRLTRIVATDCGSTTTKAILIEWVDGEYRQTIRGEAPTTVEAPLNDVTKGVINATQELEELARLKYNNPNIKFMENGEFVIPRQGDVGVDAYVSTSSAGGGLQMMVTGVVASMTGESAERAALGAGAIVMDLIASNDKRMNHEKIERIRQLRPDMILMAGGEDGGTVKHVVEMAELVSGADPRPRLGAGYKLPVIYAGNKEAQENIKETLKDKVELIMTDNIRPKLETENLGPARDKIHDLFMEHVMQQAPGYDKLMKWTMGPDHKNVPIMPTPAAVGNIMQTIAKDESIEVMGVDIGGATTDVFSVFTEEFVFNRTVSANLGMSYSISNVLASAGLENIMRWVPFDINESELRNMIKNKMIRPTTIPSLLEELVLEQAIAKEALRLALEQHKQFASSLKGMQRQRDISEAFSQSTSGATIVDMMTLDLLVGSGGVLSHAPRRNQTAMMLIDAFLPEGITRLAVDSIFMMPHLGVLSEISTKAATEVFRKDCMVYLGSCVAPVGRGKLGKKALHAKIELPDGKVFEEEIPYGEVRLIPLGVGEVAKATLKTSGGLILDEEKNKELHIDLHGGVVGIVLDTRGRRPFGIPTEKQQRIEYLKKWMREFDAYPETILV
ncbi:MAG: methylaspartate mutase [Candidatus Cloacimonetes bacterium]|nr:glutamate mutase L [Candidatus Cloacimonadota bacterium]NLO12421.1 methylaspartate mutase [Candidatus Cloacimonadota bacterium]